MNAVYANKIAEVEAAEGAAARDDFVAARRAEYLEDVDLERLAADLVIDQVVEADQLRDELLLRGCGMPRTGTATSRPSAAAYHRCDRAAFPPARPLLTNSELVCRGRRPTAPSHQ